MARTFVKVADQPSSEQTAHNQSFAPEAHPQVACHFVPEVICPALKRDGKQGELPMIYGRPIIQAVDSLDVFFQRLLPRTVLPPSDSDWRAKKLKELIDQQH